MTHRSATHRIPTDGARRGRPGRTGRIVVVVLTLALVTASCGGGDDGSDGGSLTIYSGRSEELVGPIIETFIDESGIDVEVRYGDSAELAATILEEGDNSPADLFIAQDPASLGAVALDGLLSALPEDILDRVPATLADVDGQWVGISGRSRVVAYDTTVVDPADLPADENGFTDPAWAGRVGLAPTNGSFLSFVSAKILLDGEEATLAWLQAMVANDAPTFPNNSTIVTAVNDGQVETGLVNHYYWYRLADELGAENLNVANHFFDEPSAASLVMPAGAGILASADNTEEALAMLDFLLSTEAQTYFSEETFEYPLVEGVEPQPGLPPIASLQQPDISLSDLATVLDTATDLVATAGLL